MRRRFVLFLMASLIVLGTTVGETQTFKLPTDNVNPCGVTRAPQGGPKDFTLEPLAYLFRETSSTKSKPEEGLGSYGTAKRSLNVGSYYSKIFSNQKDCPWCTRPQGADCDCAAMQRAIDELLKYITPVQISFLRSARPA